jgi:hypothetical protein
MNAAGLKRRWLKTLHSETSNRSYNTSSSFNDMNSNHNVAPVHQENDIKYTECNSLKVYEDYSRAAVAKVVRSSFTGDFSITGGWMSSVIRGGPNDKRRAAFGVGEFDVDRSVSLYEGSSSGNGIFAGTYDFKNFLFRTWA